ncbi:MAG: hypothetical protein WCJ69_15850 [Betaproteobacteria bacterium]
MKKVRNYFWYIGAPIAAVAFGAFYFQSAIVSTVKGNPHPQINYIIFALIIAGCAMILGHVARMARDARFIDEVFEKARSGGDAEALRAFIESSRRDARAVLELLPDMLGKAVSPVQHAALEAEQHRYQAKQARYLILPQFLSGMMVGLGLFGTFIGLLGALAEIGKLVGAFSLTMGGDPSEAIRVLVERLTAPMQAMGVAFSASLFGVLGSLVMGVLQVGLRNCSGELVSLLDTRVTYLIDFNKSGVDGGDMESLGDAIGALAEQSPVLKGLGIALDQSEKRVRELVNSMLQLTSRVEVSERQVGQLVTLLTEERGREEATRKLLQETNGSLGTLADRWVAAERTEERIHGLLIAQQARQDEFGLAMAEAAKIQRDVNERLAEALVQAQAAQQTNVEQITTLTSSFRDTGDQLLVSLRDLAAVQRRGSDQLVETMQTEFKDMAALQRREADKVAEATQSGLRDLAGAQRRAHEESTREVTGALTALAQVIEGQKTEQRTFSQVVGRLGTTLTQLSEQNAASLKAVFDLHQRRQEELVQQHGETVGRLGGVVEQSLSSQAESMQNLGASISTMARGLQAEVVNSTQLVNRLELLLQESTDRQSQIVENLLTSIQELRPASEDASA